MKKIIIVFLIVGLGTIASAESLKCGYYGAKMVETKNEFNRAVEFKIKHQIKLTFRELIRYAEIVVVKCEKDSKYSIVGLELLKLNKKYKKSIKKF